MPPPSDQDPTRILLACAGVIVILLVGAALVMWLRRRFLEPAGNPEHNSAGFTLGDLRRLHKSGQMTSEEFERARAAVVAAAKRAALRDEQKKAPPRVDEEAADQ